MQDRGTPPTMTVDCDLVSSTQTIFVGDRIAPHDHILRRAIQLSQLGRARAKIFPEIRGGQSSQMPSGFARQQADDSLQWKPQFEPVPTRRDLTNRPQA